MSLRDIPIDIAPRTLPSRFSRRDLLLKRLLDLTVGFAVFVVLLPVFLVVAGIIKLDSPGPVLFRQMRVGRNRRLFQMYKFRTMHVGTPELPTDKLATARSPVTRVGRYLRLASIDELPQLWNVVRGEMSLVGPRPVLYNHESILVLRDAEGLHVCKPGITGLAQINGRDAIDDAAKVAFDKDYLENFSLFLDVAILWRTVRVVASRAGAN